MYAPIQGADLLKEAIDLEVLLIILMHVLGLQTYRLISQPRREGGGEGLVKAQPTWPVQASPDVGALESHLKATPWINFIEDCVDMGFQV